MSERKKRGNAYYLGVLERRHPAIYARYLAGEFKSVASALQATGIRKPPKPAHALMRAWRDASEAERKKFLESIGASRPGDAPKWTNIATPDRKLTEHAKRRFKALFPMSPFPCGYIMSAIGRPTTDVSLMHAIQSGYKLKPELIAKLNVWLPAEEARRRALVDK